MIYLVKAKDGVLRFCSRCALVRSVWVGVDDGDVIVACSFCQGVVQRVELQRKPECAANVESSAR